MNCNIQTFQLCPKCNIVCEIYSDGYYTSCLYCHDEIPHHFPLIDGRSYIVGNVDIEAIREGIGDVKVFLQRIDQTSLDGLAAHNELKSLMLSNSGG